MIASNAVGAAYAEATFPTTARKAADAPTVDKVKARKEDIRSYQLVLTLIEPADDRSKKRQAAQP